MTKTRTAYVCGDCGSDHPQWQGQCADCGAWNTLKRVSVGTFIDPVSTQLEAVGYSGDQAQVRRLSDIQTEESPRLSSGSLELDRVLGGGFVSGSVVLLGGDPGAGKSTLLLQVVANLAGQVSCLYISGEESMQQIAGRAKRLGVHAGDLKLASVTSTECVATLVSQNSPELVVIDSIQVMRVEGVDSVPGSVTQVRESAALLTRLAKQTDTVIVLVGHVTKDGGIAGPKTLEHMIDCFLMLDAPSGSRYRTLRGVKNRFGAVNELGVFAMTDQGMREVRNPSAIFLERSGTPAPGSVVTVVWEGTRPLLVEIQALVDDAHGGYPKRIAVGLDGQRLFMHLAILHRHCGLSLADQDIFTNVTGGVKVTETAVDLALIVSVYSSMRNRTLPSDLVIFGELGLTGEIRPVPNGQGRISEAIKHGFRKAIVPKANRPPARLDDIDIRSVATLSDALDAVNGMTE